MTLHEAIQKVLKENSSLSVSTITDIINSNGYYIRNDRRSLTRNQVSSRIKNYPLLFQNINGKIILLEENNIQNIITSYTYLTNLLKGIYISADIQFIVSVILFYKRLVDLKEAPFEKYSDNSTETENSINRLLDGGNILIENLKKLDNYYIGPEGIFEECTRLLLKLDNYKKTEIWHLFNQINTSNISTEIFGDIYDYLLNLEYLQGNKSHIFYTPTSLKELMVELLNPLAEKSIYDPTAGHGGLLIQALKYNSLNNHISKGSEINKRITQLGNMNLIMNGFKNHSIESKDCFGEINNDNKFDYIIADLPINGITNSFEQFLLYNHYNLEAPRSGKGLGSLVLLALSRLKNDGKAVLTVSENFLFKKGKEKNIRDLLINNDFIESVISLPVGALRPHTDAKASILIINKAKKSDLRNKIKFIKGKAIELDKKSMVIDNDAILKAFHSDYAFSKDVQIISVTELRNDSNLSVESYDDNFVISNLMLNEGTGKLLVDLAEIKAGTQPDKNDIIEHGEIPLIKIENLSRDILDINLTKDFKYFINTYEKYQRYLINQDCILIARIGDNLKPTIYKHNKDSHGIILHSGVYALIPSKRKDNVDLEYLYYQLHSTFVLDQIKSKKSGVVMPYISIANLNQIIIPYIQFETQKSFVNTQRANLIAEERSRFEERVKELGHIEEVEEKESEIVKTLVHQLRPTLLVVDNLTNQINRIIEKNKLTEIVEFDDEDLDTEIDPDLNALFQQSNNYSLKELLEKLSNDTKHLSNILTNVDKVMNFKIDYSDLEEVDIHNFLTEYKKLKDIEIANKYLFEIKGDHVKVLLNKSSFKELLDQLILNAEKHGFSNKKQIKGNKITFSIKSDNLRNILILDYSNNGSPFLLNETDFITPFEKGINSTGSGIGGNYIYRIIKAHNGKIKIQDNNTKGFSMTIEMPLNQNKNYE